MLKDRLFALNAILLAVCLGYRQEVFATSETLQGYVTYVVEDSIYLEIIGEHHLKPGDTGNVMLRGREAAYVRVTEAASRYIYVQIISQDNGVTLSSGDSIVLEIRSKAGKAPPAASPESSKWKSLDRLVLGQNMEEKASNETPEEAPPSEGSTLKSGQSDADFAPVLVPLSVSASSKAGLSQDANIFHGQLRNREIYQTVPSAENHSLESRIDSDGSVERLYASRWSAVWSGNVSYLDGNTGLTAPDFEHPRLNVYNAMLTRKNDDGGITKLGRFLPVELPGLGFLDGGQVDHVVSPELRVGGILGLRPNRITLDATTQEPFMSAYATTEQGTHNELYYASTMGMFHTIYKGAADELAALYDGRVDLGPKLNLVGSTQVDFNDGAARVHRGPQIIRLDLIANSPITPTTTLRAGANHFQRPDIQAERDLTQGTTIGFDLGFWRYFIGANERLWWNFNLDEDLSVINSATSSTDQLWRITLSRFGFVFLPRGQIALSAYNVTSAQGRGFGFQATASTPLWSDNISMNFSSSSQYSTPADSPKQFNVNDAAVRLNWRITTAWNADVGISQSYGSGRVTSTVGDSSIAYRW